MATFVKHAIHEHDVVALTQPVAAVETSGTWAAGTEGTVVNEVGEHKLIEIANDQGEALDFISQTEDKLQLISKHSR